MNKSHRHRNPKFAVLPLMFVTSLIAVFANGTARADDAEQKTVRVIILAGQSNMEGQGVVDLDHPKHYNGGRGTLLRVMQNTKHRDRYAHIQDTGGNWVERDDVFVRFVTRHEIKRGPLSIGFAGYPGRHHIGPEFQFGHVVGGSISDPVLLIKTAWGGKSLFKDFRPPSSGGTVGEYYKKMLDEVEQGLSAIAKEFPALANHRPVISGFVWFQGWNDMYDEKARTGYASNLKNLIKDVRQHFKTPLLPVVVGELGNGGPDASKNMLAIRAAQREAATDKSLAPIEFVSTTAFARPKDESPNVGHGHHWFGNAESYFLIGDALGHAMVKSLQAK